MSEQLAPHVPGAETGTGVAAGRRRRDRGRPQGLQGEDAAAGARRVHRSANGLSDEQEAMIDELPKYEKQAAEPELRRRTARRRRLRSDASGKEDDGGIPGVRVRACAPGAAGTGQEAGLGPPDFENLTTNKGQGENVSRIRRNKSGRWPLRPRPSRSWPRWWEALRESRSSRGTSKRPSTARSRRRRSRRRKRRRSTLTLEGKLKTTDGTHIPAAKTISLDFDKAGELFTKGLPSCKQSEIESTLTAQAKSVLRGRPGRHRPGLGRHRLPGTASVRRQRPAADLQRLQGQASRRCCCTSTRKCRRRRPSSSR